MLAEVHPTLSVGAISRDSRKYESRALPELYKIAQIENRWRRSIDAFYMTSIDQTSGNRMMNLAYRGERWSAQPLPGQREIEVFCPITEIAMPRHPGRFYHRKT